MAEDHSTRTRNSPRPRRRNCRCGSGLLEELEYDGHGIFLFYCCDKCRKAKLRGFRPDIKEKYWTDEPIEPED
jgi:hypothetical protein